ncbi:MAG: DNA (cytosine-5-)-methyltransferase [Nitrospirae bacterium]|nr:DNA (cytosine-5-)-methyltransferase [Nitrospirota bacterium]
MDIRERAGVVDVFCGAGGMTHGFVKEKFRVIAGIDSDGSCSYAFKENNGAQFIQRDISQINVYEILKLYADIEIKILVGCAPCQPFSKYTNRKTEDKKWNLLYDFGRLIEKIEPDIVSMENVPELAKRKKYPVYDDFVNLLERNGYFVSANLVYCPDYGIPQTRTRLVLLASRRGKIDLIPKTHTSRDYKTVRQTIAHLEPIKDGEVNATDPLHRTSRLSELNRKRIRSTPEGGGWRDWDESLMCDCHKKASGKNYVAIYGRMSWDDQSPTITTQCTGYGNGRFGHPEQDRAISLREAALLQTFPVDYDFIDPNLKTSAGAIARHIGNAVPVQLGAIIARSIRKHMEEHYAR